MGDFQLRRLGMVMEPEPGNPHEADGVLNPAAARGPDGKLYLFPRLVAKGNYSRIGMARVRFNADGDPVGVERLGIALEPEADYERRPDGGGGREDGRQPNWCGAPRLTPSPPGRCRCPLGVSAWLASHIDTVTRSRTNPGIQFSVLP